jgi:hypothetical protein
VILILEDNADRVRDFLATAATVAPELPVRVWGNAPDMTGDLIDALELATLISLDHDLISPAGDPSDPGTGYDVAKLLGELIPCCPVIVHTSNADRGGWMSGELVRGGWRVRRVYPYGDDWIRTRWADAVRRLLNR